MRTRCKHVFQVYLSLFCAVSLSCGVLPFTPSISPKSGKPDSSIGHGTKSPIYESSICFCSLRAWGLRWLRGLTLRYVIWQQVPYELKQSKHYFTKWNKYWLANLAKLINALQFIPPFNKCKFAAGCPFIALSYTCRFWKWLQRPHIQVLVCYTHTARYYQCFILAGRNLCRSICSCFQSAGWKTLVDHGRIFSHGIWSTFTRLCGRR